MWLGPSEQKAAYYQPDGEFLLRSCHSWLQEVSGFLAAMWEGFLSLNVAMGGGEGFIA
jgi:hypothetical protein